MDCETVRLHLHADQRGHLGPELHRELRAHLEGCPACTHEEAAEHVLTEVLARAYGPKVRANVIAPGSIDTPRFRKVTERMDDSGSFLAMLERTIPMGRLGLADDVARLALFLAGDGSAYTTGAVIPCDGGLAAFR